MVRARGHMVTEVHCLPIVSTSADFVLTQLSEIKC